MTNQKKNQSIFTTSASQALSLIKAGQFNSEIVVQFTHEKIDAFDAILLGKNGIEVPEELIEYDDDKIDYSEIPPVYPL